MEKDKREIKKIILTHALTFVISFLLGFFSHDIILPAKQVPVEEEKSGELEIIIQEDLNKDKIVQSEKGCGIYVDVSGALKNPGVYCLEEGSLVIDAINKAGGLLKDSANRFISRKVNLAQPLVNNQKIYFPFEKELICQIIQFSEEAENVFVNPTNDPNVNPNIDQNTTTTPSVSNTNNANTNNTQCVNINTATKEQLTALNGIGESTATKIISGRPYTKVDDLLNVSGIGEATLAKFKEDVCI